MIRIKESTKDFYRISSAPDNYIENRLSVETHLSEKTGIDILKKHSIQFVHGDKKADIGLSKHGDKVSGVPRDRCILIKKEPPIYNLFWGLRLCKPRYLKKYAAVMSIYEINGLNQKNFHVPQPALKDIDTYFYRKKTGFLCMILRNKTLAMKINSLIPSLRKFTKKNNMKVRKESDKVFCKKLGPKLYHSFGRGWNQKCFKGSVPDGKIRSILSEYKFNFCPENSCFKNYVTEKPIRAMCCGSIPIYLGAPDVEKYIPKGTFIDYREYNPDELVDYLKNMENKEYREYLSNIREFLKSDKIIEFTSIAFANKLIKVIKEVYNKKCK